MTSTQPRPHDGNVYWHRELPPLDADPAGEYTIEATSARVGDPFMDRDAVWRQCYSPLVAETGRRVQQEIERLGGRYARIVDESIDVRHDDATSEAWLHGRFTYRLYR
jgi:hypothetical protein